MRREGRTGGSAGHGLPEDMAPSIQQTLVGRDSLPRPVPGTLDQTTCSQG